MINALVLGCAGYISSKLTHYLHDNYRDVSIIGVDKLMYPNSRQVISGLSSLDRFDFHKIDVVSEFNKLEPLIGQSDVIFANCAYVGAPLCAKKPLESKAINEDFVKMLVDSLSSGQKLIYPNTNSSYGNSKSDGKLTENTPMEPISEYGVQKANAEKYVLDNHYNSVVFRLGTVYGLSPRPRYDLLVHDLSAQAIFNKRFVLFEPYYKRNFVHIEDVVAGMSYFAFSKHVGVFNFNQPTCETKLTLAHKVSDCVSGCYNIDVDISIGNGRDLDQRNYDISIDKLYIETNFRLLHEEIGSMGDLREIVKFTEQVGPEFIKGCSNMVIC